MTQHTHHSPGPHSTPPGPGHDPAGHGGRGPYPGTDIATRRMALSATLHCLTGCAIGEIFGLVIGTTLGLSTGWTIALAVGLAFLFGYALSTLPLLRAGLGFGTALSVVLAADTLSIATMELVDNAVMAVVPGAMDAGLVNSTFWLAMGLALTAAFLAAYPVNRHLLARGRGHALTHDYHGSVEVSGWRRYVPELGTSTLVAAIAAFMFGGLVVSAAAEQERGAGVDTGSHGSATP